MSTVEQIEKAIQGLPRNEFLRLHKWIQDHFDDQWDEQVAEDAARGRLDAVAQKALAEHRAGRSKPFPPDDK